MQDFSVEGVQKMFGGSHFSMVERNFTIGQRPNIWGNFSKICIKINKKLKNIEKIREKCKFLRKFFNFPEGHKFLIMGQINNLIWTCCNGGLGAELPEGRKNFRKFVEIGNVKFNDNKNCMNFLHGVGQKYKNN